jgi:ubiquinone/menaquinone biosynthesis C-methylase UbiE
MAFSVCPCCMSSPLLLCLVAGALFLQFLSSVIKAITPKSKAMRVLASMIYWLIALSLAAFAVFLGVLSANEDLQQRFFSILCMRLSSKTELNPIRCELLKNVKGNILEFGPGPATNFVCLHNNTNIDKWTGVEPNKYFQEAITKEKEKFNVAFPVNTVWLNGENVDVEPESYDYVVATHVLCSVKEVDKVLHQVARALKPGGSYLFLEHVSADEGTVMYYLQKVFQPIFNIVGNGCHFKPSWEYLSDKYVADFKDFDIEIEHINAPVGIPILVPHIRGIATKRMKKSRIVEPPADSASKVVIDSLAQQ